VVVGSALFEAQRPRIVLELLVAPSLEDRVAPLEHVTDEQPARLDQAVDLRERRLPTGAAERLGQAAPHPHVNPSLRPRPGRAPPRRWRVGPPSRSASSAPLSGSLSTKRRRRRSAARWPTAIGSSPAPTSKKGSTPFSPSAHQSSRLDATAPNYKKGNEIEAGAALVAAIMVLSCAQYPGGNDDQQTHAIGRNFIRSSGNRSSAHRPRAGGEALSLCL